MMPMRVLIEIINTPEGVFMVKLFGVISLGSFIGEFHRGAIAGKVNKKLFLSSILAGGFLSYVISMAYYYNFGQNRATTFLLGAFLSYQNERYISKFIEMVVEGKFIIAFINSVKSIMRENNGNSNGNSNGNRDENANGKNRK